MIEVFSIQYKYSTLFGIYNGTPFFKNAMAVSGWPKVEAICIRVLPSLVLAESPALNLSNSRSTMWVCPRSAAICIGVLSN